MKKINNTSNPRFKFNLAKTLFMGNGDKSAAKCYDLMARLSKGFDNLGALQQSAGYKHIDIMHLDRNDPHQKQLDRMVFENHQLAQDLVLALTGHFLDVFNYGKHII